MAIALYKARMQVKGTKKMRIKLESIYGKCDLNGQYKSPIGYQIPNYLLGSSVKIDHSNDTKDKKRQGYLSTVMYLAPSDTSKSINVCPFATPQCKSTCLVSSSYHMNLDASVSARLNRTLFFLHDRQGFKAMLYKNIVKHIKKAIKTNRIPVIRLNGTSDLPFEKIFPELFTDFPGVQWYDYTKYPITKRVNLPSNYYLLRSHSEENHSELDAMLQVGNVAVVFNTKKGQALPKTWNGYEVLNGDQDDLRFKDATPKRIVALYAKGKAKKLTATDTGFLVKAF